MTCRALGVPALRSCDPRGAGAGGQYIAGMATEESRMAAAAGLRDLIHAFAAHDPDDDVLATIADDGERARAAGRRGAGT